MIQHADHTVTEYERDNGSFAVAVCACGWKSNPCSDSDIACSEWWDHFDAATHTEGTGGQS